MQIIKLKRPPCARSYVSIVSVWDQIIGSTRAYEVPSHPCSVSTAEVESVNHGEGENHGKDWDYTPINVAPWTLEIFNEQVHESKWEPLHCFSFKLWCVIIRCWSLSCLFVRVLPGYWLGCHLWCWLSGRPGVRWKVCYENNIPTLPENHHILNTCAIG